MPRGGERLSSSWGNEGEGFCFFAVAVVVDAAGVAAAAAAAVSSFFFSTFSSALSFSAAAPGFFLPLLATSLPTSSNCFASVTCRATSSLLVSPTSSDSRAAAPALCAAAPAAAEA